jgi:nucleotide-binding universal stress UspA family protein
MTRSASPSLTVLVDVELPDPEPLPDALVGLLSPLQIVLVGWYAIPEQTAPDQAREQFEPEAQAALDAAARPFIDRGASIETILVFTPDQFASIEQISIETGCDAILLPGRMEGLDQILLPVRGLHNAEKIAPVCAALVRNGTTTVTLLHVVEEEESAEAARTEVLDPMTRALVRSGIDAGMIFQEAVSAPSAVDAIIDRAAHSDAVIIGETDPSMREILFGTVPEQIVERAEVPVVLVRNPN